MNDHPVPVQPTGTITFLFTDIEGSTKLWEAVPEAMQTALARHDAILRAAVEANRGRVIKTTGDGVHAGFPNALDAVRAALDAQRQLQAPLGDLQLKVRMGVHTGEAESRAGDYYGTALNRAARLMSAAHGGQILLSHASAELLLDHLPQDASLRDLGEHRLKDLARPEHIFQLAHPGLPGEFPPLKTIDSFPNNLPVQLTSFIGRERTIERIRALLAANRLVTLTGSGGTGKTRLSLEVGAHELASFIHGVWLIELAPLTDPRQITATLAQVFGLQEVPHTSLANLVLEYLRGRHVLILLDNCEHLIEACARLADDLLRSCPHVKIVASSREALGIAGEIAFHTPSLDETESARLFVERAFAANPDFVQTEAGAAAIAKICARLDGIPLAIELAAARARLLTPEQIASRLDDRFRLLVGGSRTALPRQQTLRALIDWSYDLLSDGEKRLLRSASVFMGGWTLAALEAVVQDPDGLELLEQLVNKSLVTVEEHGSQMRYTLLETIRQYAREKLFDAGVAEAGQARNRHLQFFVQLAESSTVRLTGPEMIECMDELETEQDNLRAAVDWAIETDPLSALRIAAILPFFWGRRLSATEGYAWVRAALARAEESIHLQGNTAAPYLNARATALIGEAALAFQMGNNDSARIAIDASIATARQINATETLAFALALGATICGFLGDVLTAQAWSHEARDLSSQHGFTYTLATVTGMEVFLSIIMNQPVSLDDTDEIIRIARLSGNPWALAMAYTNVGRTKAWAGRWAEASALLEQAAALFNKIGDKAQYNASRSEIGHLLRKQGRFSDAQAVYHETITTYMARSQQAAVAHELECFAFIASAQNIHDRAAILLGAAEALRERLKIDMTPIERREYEEVVAALRTRIEEKVFEKTWSAGRALTTEQAVEFALLQSA